MKMNEWMKTASATFAGGAVAIALVAIPTFVWLPREFDEINMKLEAALTESMAARNSADAATAASTSTLQSIDNLVIAIAKMDAKPIIFLIEGNLGADALLSSDQSSRFKDLLAPDVFTLIVKSEAAKGFTYSYFGGEDWLFVKRKSLNAFTLDDQKRIEEAMRKSNVRFIVE